MALKISFNSDRYKYTFPEAYCKVVSTTADNNGAQPVMNIQVAFYCSEVSRQEGGRVLDHKNYTYPYQGIVSGYDAFELAYQVLKTEEAIFSAAVDVLE